jgi:hypothetical protein
MNAGNGKSISLHEARELFRRFWEAEEIVFYSDEEVEATRQLEHDDGMMPRKLCDEFDLPAGSTYAEGYKVAREKLREYADVRRSLEEMGTAEEEAAEALMELLSRPPNDARDTYEYGFAAARLQTLRWVLDWDWDEPDIGDP